MVIILKRCKTPFLSPDLVEDGELATIIEPPFVQSAETSTFGRERTIITVELRSTGQVCRWGLNNTSSDNLVETFGPEGDDWIDRDVYIRKRKENVIGQDRDVLYAIPPNEEGSA